METENPAPEGLSPAAKRWWVRLMGDYEDWASADLLVLEGALQAWDRWQAARKQIDAEGATVTDRFGQRRVHPAIAIERGSRAAYQRAIKQINLADEPPLSVSEKARKAVMHRWNKGAA